MIPVLFKEDEQIFSHNGIGALYESLSCDIYEAENGAFTLEMEYPVDGEWFSELKDFRIIQAKPNDIDEPHNFRIYEIEKSIDELSVYVRANTRTNDLGSNLITNYVGSDVTPQQAMNGIKNNLIEPTNFDLISDIQTRSNVEWTRLNPLNAIVGVRGSLVDVWGGEIKRTNNAIYLYSRRGRDNVTTIRPGKNIEGLDMTVSTAGLITKILPSYSYRPVEVPKYQMVEMSDGTREKRRVPNSGDTTLKDDLTVLGDVVTSQYVNNYPIHYWASVDYNSDDELTETINNYIDNRLEEAEESESILNMSNFDKDLEEFVKAELDKKAKGYFTHRNPGADKPTVRINVNMLQLSDSPEWELFENLERIGLTDTLDVWVDKYDIDVEVRVTGLNYDSIGERVTGFNAGSDRAPRQSAIEKKYDDLTQATNDYISSFKNGVQNIMRNTADGLNRKFEGYTEPPAELSSEGDIWFKEIGEGKVEIWIHDGVYWQPLLSEDFANQIQAEVDNATEAANKAVDEINNAVESAGFTSLEEAVLDIQNVSNDAQSNAQQAINDALEAFTSAQSALSGLDDKVDTSVYNTTLIDLEAGIDSAITAGNTAKETAEDAISTANTAKETAEGLITQVGDIGSVANSALQEAKDAVGTANTAKTSADNLSTEVSGLKTDVEGFELTVNNYQDQVSQFSADVDGFQSTVASYETEVDEFGNIVSTNTTQLNELRNDIDGFEILLASYDEDLDGFNTTVSSFRNTLEGLESTVASYETEVDEYGNEVATYATELSTLRNTVTGFESTVAEFDTTVTGYQTSLTTLTNTVDGFESTVANYETQVDEYGNEVASYATEVSTLENTVSGFNSLVASFTEEAEGYSAAVSEFRNTVSGLQSTVASYEVELDEYGNTVDSYATQVATFNNTVDGLESSVTAYEQSVSGYATQLATLTNTVDGFNSTVTGYETQLDEYGDTVATYGTEVSDLAGEVVGYKNQVSTLNNTVDGFNSTVANYTTEVDELGEEVESYATEVSTLTNTVSGFQSTVSRVEQDYEDVSGTVATHTTQISNLDGEIALKANTSTVNSLTGRVSTAETSITANATAIGLKANTTTVNALTGRVSTAETGITANATAIGLKASQSSVDTLTGTVSTLSGKVDVTAGQISSKVWNTDIQTAVDGIEVGGRNLLLDSSFRNSENLPFRFSPIHSNLEIIGDYVVHTIKADSASVRFQIDLEVEEVGKYTYSFMANLPYNPRWRGHVGISNFEIIKTGTLNEDSLYIVSFEIESPGEVLLRAYMPQLRKGDNLYFKWEKLEKGNKATDWTPAPEDTTALINHVETTLTQKHDAIEATVSSVQTDLTGTTTLLNTTKTTVDGHTSSISTLRTDVNGKATTAQFNTLNSTVNGTIQRVGNAEGKITTIETNVSGLQTTVTSKADQSQVTQLSNSLTSTITEVEGNSTQISQNSTNINLRVKEGDVLSQINVEAGRTLIQSKKLVLNASNTTISGTTWMDGAIIQNGTIASAKIESLDASKISTGILDGIIIRSHFNYSYDGAIRNQGTTTIRDGAISSVGAFTHGHGSTYMNITPDRIYAENLMANRNVRSQFILDGQGITVVSLGETAYYRQDGITFPQGDAVIRYYDANARIEMGSYNGVTLSAVNKSGGGLLTRLSVGGGNDGITPFVDIYTKLNMRFNHIDNVSTIYLRNSNASLSGSVLNNTSDNWLEMAGRWGTRLGHRSEDNSTFHVRAEFTTTDIKFYANLNMQNNTIINNSDERLKINIVYDEIDSLDAIKNWRMAGFYWRDPEATTERQFGVIAQTTPEIASMGDNGYLNVNSSKQLQMVTHALQQLETRERSNSESNEEKIHQLQQELSKANRRIEELGGAM